MNTGPASFTCRNNGSDCGNGLARFALRRSDHIDGPEIVECGEHRWWYPLHMHEPREIIWMRTGHGEMVSRGQRVAVRAVEVCVIRPNEFHGGRAPRNTPIRFCQTHVPCSNIDPILLRRYFCSRYSGRQIPIKVISQRLAARALGRLVAGLAGATCATEQ